MSLPASNGKTVLVSGINGYIASNIGLDLLHKGYTVRGTSRSTSAKDDLLSGAFKGYESRYEHEVIPDITAAGAFDKAVNGSAPQRKITSPICLLDPAN
jgi:nucleoside-diphosphate-sugar epimerase